MAFLLCCLGGLAAAHILEALSIRRDAARATADATGHAPSDGGRPLSEPTELVGAGGDAQPAAVSLRPLLAPTGATSADPATAERDLRIFWAFLAFAVVAAVATATTRVQANPALALLVGTLVLVAAHRYLLAWPTLLGAVIVVILFIPIRRYTLAGELPIALEPYRLLLAAVLLAWLLAVLVDPETRWRRTRLEAPLIGLRGRPSWLARASTSARSARRASSTRSSSRSRSS